MTVLHVATTASATFSSASGSITATVAKGELLVLTHMAGTGVWYPSDPTGGDIKWLKRAAQGSAFTESSITTWTAVAPASGSITITTTIANATGQGTPGWQLTLSRFTGAGVGAVASSANSGSQPSLTITTTSPNSFIYQAITDYNTATGARTYRTGAGAFTETFYVNTAPWYTNEVGYHASPGAAGAKVVGLTAPTGQQAGHVALELIPTSVDPTNLWKSPQQVDNYVAANPELAPLAAQPVSKWINNASDASAIPGFVTAAAGKTLLLTIYAIPGRDSGGYSGGGFPDRASYLSFIQSIKTNLGNAPAIINFEPDAVGLANGMAAATKAERLETLRQAVDILATIPNAESYIEASQWVDTTTQASLLQQVDIALIHGFSINTSGYDSQAVNYTYGNAVVAGLVALGITGKQYIVDSSRNGSGALTEADRPLASPWLDTQQAWCNPPKRTIGLVPGLVAGQPNVRATVWIKAPGESDGTFPTVAQSSYFGENAPAAGTFWVPIARDLLGLTPQPAGGAGTVSDVVASFDTDWGSFTILSAGATRVGGRARIPVGVNTYENIDTAHTYTMLGGSVSARLYPHAAAGGTSTSLDFIVTSPTDGTRLITRIDPALNEIMFAAESGYYDPAQVKLPYDSTAHAYARMRESGGTVYWDTSPDGTNWTNRKSAARPTWITTAKTSSVQFVANRDAGTVNYAEVDSVNVAPLVVRVVDRWDGTALVRQRTDRWDGTALIQQVHTPA